MAERKTGTRAEKSRSIEAGRIKAMSKIVNGFGKDGVLANHRRGSASPPADAGIRFLSRRLDALI